ncbi:unnamed protein product [Phytomonas sp. EM1]|nr:unnamed protein product [Phytomonas sp. EM1]|eukprot:CCW59661.1 unnamed protein product [Phytomonas sp. isolate EM1]
MKTCSHAPPLLNISKEWQGYEGLKHI